MAARRYRRSYALEVWLERRRAELSAIEGAHRHLGRLRPSSDSIASGREQLSAAFVVQMYAEFQGFVRDLHEETTLAFARGVGVPAQHRHKLVEGLTDGRRLDQGNATLAAIRQDFGRLGIAALGASLANNNLHHAADKARYEDFTNLRNALAHGNAEQLARLRARGPRPTLSWGRGTLPSLNRLARALDRSVWDHVTATYPAIEPWGTG
jgi:hypothetical protein